MGMPQENGTSEKDGSTNDEATNGTLDESAKNVSNIFWYILFFTHKYNINIIFNIDGYIWVVLLAWDYQSSYFS